MLRFGGRLATSICVLVGLLSAVAAPVVAASSAHDSVHYWVRPQFKDGRLADLDISLSLATRPGSDLVFSLPDTPGHQDPKSLVFRLSGALRMQDGAAPEVRVHATSGTVTMHYQVPVEASDAVAVDSPRPILRASWLALRGSELLTIPRRSDGRAAVVDVAAFPAGWTSAWSLPRNTTVARLADGLLAGGDEHFVNREAVSGVEVLYPAALNAIAGDIVRDMLRIKVAEHAFWRTGDPPLLISVVQLTDDSDYSGRGASDGLALYLGAHVESAPLLRLIAHESLHRWISRAIGGFPERDADLQAWMNEGFTEAYTARLLLESGLWTPARFVDDWNVALARYGTSPLRNAPNTTILADRQTDFDANKLPYDRGRIIAVILDRKIRTQTEGRVGLDDVLRAQVAQALQNQRAGRRVSADRLFPIVVDRVAHVDVTVDLERLVDRGQDVVIPPGAFGACVATAETTQPVFDRGFDLAATMRNHRHVTRLEPGGPAERAGLRENDRIAVDEIPSHDSRVALRYRVDNADGAGSHVIRYFPVGKGTVTFQQLRYMPETGLGTSSCQKDMLVP